ncbi:MAG TPA: outer membrane protein assembly factor BamA [Candidatus Polarisedimenticolaceae bacterium]|nr:outer membrane protein assembly factor BamA [Candidatus Polarisedimenticolaceae bacterium]
MSLRTAKTAFAFFALLFLASLAFGDAGTIDEVQVQGLVRMTSEAFAHAFGIRAGDPYDPARIRTQFKALWALGIFDDLTIEAEDGPKGGKVLILKVKERPSLSSVSYEDNKALTRTAIEERLRDKKIALDVGKPLNLKTVADAEAEIRMMLGEKGYLDADVSHTIGSPTQSTASVDFKIRTGGKTRIKKIVFLGNHVHKSKELLRQLQLTAPYHWYKFWSQKSLYHPAKWDQDSSHIRDLYLNGGYLDVDLRPPVVELKEDRKESKKAAQAPPRAEAPPPPPPPPDTSTMTQKERKSAAKEQKKAERAAKKAEPKVKRWAYLTVTVVEGPRYSIGQLSASGNTVYTEPELLAQVPLKKGSVASNGYLELGLKRMQRIYEDKGYAYATVRREIDRHPDEKVADVRFIVNEDKPYYVGRIEFVGNTATQDKVLRREFRLNEGDLFNRSVLDLSVRKVNQLGYFEARPENVSVEPVEGTNKVRVQVPGEERGRNEVQVGGGYSGADGAFFTGYYSTKNFLGRGQIVSLSLQLGGRRNLYQIAVQEPWFLNRPYTLGFTLYRGDQDYGARQRSQGRGFGVVIGRQIGYFQQVQMRYDFQKVKSNGLQPQVGFATAAGSSAPLSPVVASNTISKVTPSWYWNSINDPYRPSAGWSLLTDLEVAGGPLGGDTAYLRPRTILTRYFRAWRRTFFGIHAEIGQIKTWSGGSNANAANVNGIPRFSRFWLGGESYGPRVFQTRDVSPLRYVRVNAAGEVVETTTDPSGRPVSDFDLNGDGVINRNDLVALGGDRYWLTMFEYTVPFQTPVEVAFFADFGNTLYEDTAWGLADYRAAAGIEVRFYLPVFPVPLRLIYGWPLRKLPEDRTSAFTFSIGRSF